MRSVYRVTLLAFITVSALCQGAVQYWDVSPSAGYQQGDGTWSTAAADTNWSANGTALTPWVNANDALFSVKGGASTVTLYTSLTSSAVTVTGSVYTLVVTNGGRLVSAIATLGGGKGANDNRVRVAGGSGVTSLWAATAISVGGGNTASLNGASNNVWVIDGCGIAGSAVTTNSGALDVGRQTFCPSNELQVIGGGALFTGGATTIGATTIGNILRVRGAGSAWLAGSSLSPTVLTVGSGAGAIGNLVIVDDGAYVTNSGALTVGNTATSSDNEVRVTGGGRLLTGSTTIIGSTALANAARVQGGGSHWLSSGTVSVGSGAGATYNTLVVDGLGVSGSATATIATLAIGYNGTAALPAMHNSVVVTNGGVLVLGAGGNWGNASGHGIGMVDNNVYQSKSNALVITQGGKVVSSGALLVGYNDYNANLKGNRLVVMGAESLLDMQGNPIYAPFSYAANAVCIAGVDVLIDAGIATNVGGLVMPYVTAGQAAHNNTLTITNSGRFHASAACSVGATYPGTNNIACVTGGGSLWDLGNNALTLGNAAGTNNGLVIDQGGRVDAIGTLTVFSNNTLSLRGGTLGVFNWTLNNGAPFTAGDGVQAATLKGLGGTLQFNAGLLISSNATLTGFGSFNGGPAGISLASGGAVSPGADEIASIAILGTGLVFQSGSSYRCGITDLDLGPGFGWDLAAVTGRVVFSAGCVIRPDSRGATPAHFDPAGNYNIRILSFASQSGFDPATVTLDTTDLLTAGTWSLTNTATALYLVYRGSGAGASPDYTWNVPNRGNWSAAGNWQGGSAPAAGGGGALVLAFGDNGTPYVSTNDLAGGFLLNQLQLTSESAVTNQIKGNALVFTNGGAAVDYRAGSVGSFIVSNAITAAGDLEVGGDALAVTLTFGGAVTNMGRLIKKGSFTLALGGANDLRGPLVVDSPDGTLRLDSLSGAPTPALGNAPSLIVSNGNLLVNHQGQNCSLLTTNNRSVLVTGTGSYWTNVIGNSQFMYLTDNVTNNTVTLANGARLITPSHLWVATGPAKFNSFVISGGARAVSVAGGGVGGTVSNSATVTGTGSLWNPLGAVMTVGGTGNVMRIEAGGLFTNGSVTVGGTESALVVTNGGRMMSIGTLWIRGVRSSARISGQGSLLHSLGSSACYVGFGVSEIGNSLTVEDAAILTNINLQVGAGAGVNNRLAVTGGSKLYTSGLSVGVSSGSTGNTVLVSGSNTLAVTQVTASWIGNAGAAYNRLTVDDSAVLSNVYMIVGFDGCSYNVLVVTNGGKLFSNASYEQYISSGSFATGNAATVTGPGSVWNAAGRIVFLSSGNTSSFNRLTLEAGGLLTNVSILVTAAGIASSNNTVLINGGALQAGTLAWRNLLPNDVTLTGEGELNLTGGFALSNSNHRLFFNGGRLSVRSAVVSNTLAFAAGDGTQAATLNLLPGGVSVFSAGLAISSNATLGGSGVIIATSLVHGALSPGLAGIGSLTNNGPLTLSSGSGVRFDLAAATAPGAGWDSLAVTNGALGLAARLTPVLKEGFLPARSDRFLIMTNQGPASVSGGFSNGGRATVFAEDLKTRAGTVAIEIGLQGVVLADFQAWRPDGSLMILY